MSSNTRPSFTATHIAFFATGGDLPVTVTPSGDYFDWLDWEVGVSTPTLLRDRGTGDLWHPERGLVREVRAV